GTEWRLRGSHQRAVERGRDRQAGDAEVAPLEACRRSLDLRAAARKHGLSWSVAISQYQVELLVLQQLLDRNQVGVDREHGAGVVAADIGHESATDAGQRVQRGRVEAADGVQSHQL